MKKIFLCIISGILCGTAFLFPFLKWVLFLSPALFFYVALHSKKPFMHGFAFGTAYSAVSSSFLLTLDLEHFFTVKALSVLLPIIAFLSVALFSGAFTGIMTFAFSRLKAKAPPRLYPLLFSSLWVIYEYITGAHFLPTGYTWQRLAVPFADLTPFIQTVSLFGTLFISFTVIYFASSLSVAISQRKAAPLYFPVILIIISSVASLLMYTTPESGAFISAAAIQNGEDAYDKRSASAYDSFLSVKNEIRGAELIVFPEAAMMTDLSKSEYLTELTATAKSNNSVVLLGALYSSADEKRYTSVYLLSSDEADISSKRHPVPFGEYIPIASLFSEDIRKSNISGSDSLYPLCSGKISAGAIICFDSAFPKYSAEAVRHGANILCFSTNDSWFSSDVSARLHLYHSIYRAAENSRYCIRSACTGISAIIDSKGNVLSSMQFGDSGRASGRALLKTNRTLYSITGDAPMLLFALFIIFYSVRKGVNHGLRQKIKAKISRA